MRHQGTKPYIFHGCLSLGIFGLTTYLMMREAHLALGVSALLGINAAGLAAMGLDKSLSRSAAMRFPEAILYVIALLGGIPGVILGSHVFKHKSRKPAFQFVLLLVLVAQLIVLRFVVPQ
jgi:uncharacterized membrane protein YsdA (DUF1294 family)